MSKKITTPETTSQHLQYFLNFLSQIRSDYKNGYEEVNKQDKITGDLLHQLELGSIQERGKTTTKLVKSRKERRVAKDITAVTEPLVKWCDEHQANIKELERVLGELRKVERTMQYRAYVPRVVLDIEIAKKVNKNGDNNGND